MTPEDGEFLRYVTEYVTAHPEVGAHVTGARKKKQWLDACSSGRFPCSARLFSGGMMDWNADISPVVRSWMDFLGNFGPTVNEQSRSLKGYMHDDEGGGKVYLDAGELRELATACNEVAGWLDKRADEKTNV